MTEITLSAEETSAIQNMANFLYNGPLNYIGATDEEKLKLIDVNNLYNFWLPAFTTETFNPDSRFNYENLENLGDAALKGVFRQYTTAIYPGLTPLFYTESNTYYMGNYYMGTQLTPKLGLAPYIRMKGSEIVPDGVLADVFESFCGALLSAGNSIIQGLGYIYLYNLIVTLFNGVKFDMQRAQGSSQTQVDQIFTRFGLIKPVLIQRNNDETGINLVSVYLKIEHLEFLEKHGKNIPKLHGQEMYIGNGNKAIVYGPIGKGENYVKKEATGIAFNRALDYFHKVEVTTNWAENLKSRLEFSDKGVQPYVKSALKRAQSQGYVSMIFSVPVKSNTQTTFTMTLIGIREDGSRGTLIAGLYDRKSGGKISSEIAQARPDIIKRYIDEGN